MKLDFRCIGTIIISYISYFVGGIDNLFITLSIFMILDYVSGVLVAIKKKKLSSKIGFDGIVKKVYIILLIGAINLIGQAINIEGLRYMIISFYIANEGISIVENGSRLGVPVPQKIKDILEQLRKDEKNEEE